MDRTEVIKDVVTDFNRNKGTEFEIRLLNGFAEAFSEYDDNDFYAVCYFYLTFVKQEMKRRKTFKEDEVRKVFFEHFDRHRNLRQFRWVPEAYVKAERISNEIFELAKRYYDDENADTSKAPELLGELKRLRTEIDGATYKYGNKKHVRREYNYILSESILDLDFINDIGELCSQRMQEYIVDCELEEAYEEDSNV